jgi:hypothetical protein
MKRRTFLAASGASLAVSACGGEPPAPEYGPDPTLPPAERGLLPSMVIPRPTGWGDARPIVPDGYTITPIASDFGICRQTLMLPNGDILVSEGTGGGTSWYLKARAEARRRFARRTSLQASSKGWARVPCRAATVLPFCAMRTATASTKCAAFSLKT